MKMKANQLSSGVLLSYVGQGLQILIALFYTPVILRLLGQSEYGVYQIAYSVMSVLSLFNFGFSNSYIKFFSVAKKGENAEQQVAGLNGLFIMIFSALSVLVVAVGAVLTLKIDAVLGGSLTAAELDTARIVLPIMVLNCALSFLGVVFRNYIIAHERFIALQGLDILGTVLNPCLTFPLLLTGKGSVGLALILLAVTAVKDLFSAFYCIFKLRMRFSRCAMPWSAFRGIAVFSLFIFAENIVTAINLNVDRFFLGKMIGTAAAAIYAVGGQINTLYTTLVISISSVFAPRVNEMVAKGGDREALSALYVRVGKIQFSVMGLILGGFAVFGKRFMLIWAGSEYGDSYWIALILLLSVTLHLVQHVAVEIQRSLGLQKYRSMICIVTALLKLCVSFALIPLLGGIGAAIGTAVAYVLNTVAVDILYAKRAGLKVWVFWREITRMACGALPPVVLGLLAIRYINSCRLIVYFVCIAVFALLYLVSMYLLGLRRADRVHLRILFERWINTYLKKGKSSATAEHTPEHQQGEEEL